MTKFTPTRKTRCPHCGNTDRKLLQDNGEPPMSPTLSLLCVARVRPEDWSFDTKPEPQDYDAAGLVPCGMQWDPNSD